jgi:hypothetical protein
MVRGQQPERGQGPSCRKPVRKQGSLIRSLILLQSVQTVNLLILNSSQNHSYQIFGNSRRKVTRLEQRQFTMKEYKDLCLMSATERVNTEAKVCIIDATKVPVGDS